MSVTGRDIEEARVCLQDAGFEIARSPGVWDALAEKIAEHREKLESWQRSVTMLRINEDGQRLEELDAIRKLLDKQVAEYDSDIQMLRDKQLRDIERSFVASEKYPGQQEYKDFPFEGENI